MLPPVMVAEDQSTATAKVGDTVVFQVADPEAWKLTSSDPKVLEVQDGGPSGGAVFNPGGKALAPGRASVKMVNTKDSSQRLVQVTVTQ